jgi:hypothetical protein
LFNNIHLVKPCVSTLDTTPTFVFGVVISQGGYELGAMPSALNGGVQGQMLGLMNNVFVHKLGELMLWNSSWFGWVYELEHNGAMESIVQF